MRELLPELIERYFGAADGELVVGGIPATALAARYGTPLYVYDRGVLDRKFEQLRSALPSRFAIFYSVKANPNEVILRHLLSRGCGVEIASGGEFCRARTAGCPPERIVFAGPGKTEAELELALSEGIGEIHVESLLEVERIGSISRRLGVRARVSVRVNPSGEEEAGAMRMGSRPTPFGIDEESLDEVLDRILADSALEFRGIHLYVGTQILDHNLLLTQYRRGLNLALRLARRLGRPLHTVDLGGGLGIPYFGLEQELDLEAFRRGLCELTSRVENEPLFAGTQLLVEPGRYLVGEAGIYLARVNDIKVSRGKKFLVLDGGMNHHLSASGNLGQTIKRNYPVGLVNKLSSTADETVDIVGPLCTPLDTLARSVRLPRAQVGDLVGIFQSGAYAYTASPLGFLSHRTPPEVWVDSGRDQLVRRRGEYSDYLRDLAGTCTTR